VRDDGNLYRMRAVEVEVYDHLRLNLDMKFEGGD
jgi:hypothetical protein